MYDMDVLIEKFKEGWLNEDPRLVFAVLTGIAVFILLNILHSKSKKKLQKLKGQAIKEKSVINASIKKRYHSRRTNSQYDHRGWYRYVINGEEKEYTACDSAPLPDALQLYPKNSTGTKVFSDYDFREGFGFSANAIAGIGVCIFILFITGYIGS